MHGVYVDPYKSPGSGCQQLTVCSGILQLLAKTLPSVSTVFCEASAVWQWFNFLRTQVPAGKRPLLVNIDETSICAFQGRGRGNIFAVKPQVAQRMSRSTQRTCLTHVAFLCDDPTVQSILPQIIIGNEKTLLARELDAMRVLCPQNVRLLRCKSAWINAQLFAKIIRLLGTLLEPYRDEFQVFLFFDACNAHIGPETWTACSSARVWPIVVPARMTWLLQMLDTHAFAGYKICLQRLHQNARIVSPSGVVGIDALIVAVCGTIRAILEGRGWAHAFTSNGFGVSQAGMSSRVLQKLQLEQSLLVPVERPSTDQLKLCFPRRARVCTDNVWRPLRDSQHVLPPALVMSAPSGVSASALSAGVMPAIEVPISSRTRSRTAAAPHGCCGHRGSISQHVWLGQKRCAPGDIP